MPFDGSCPQDTQVTILQEARNLLKKGWCQHHFNLDVSPDDQQYCAVGAYRQAYRQTYPDLPPFESCNKADKLILPLLVKELPFHYRLQGGDMWSKLTTFNDVRWRRHSAVVNLYDRAIQRQLER